LATHVELFRALEPVVGAEAAEMIAEVVPPASDLMTKADLQELRADIFKWGLAAVVPIWVGVWGAFVTLLVAVLTHHLA
jgi:hypothetical protein